MKCEIAIKVNNGEFSTKAKKFGAKVLANNAVQSLNDSTFDYTVNTPTEAVLKKNDLFDNLASYVFSNPEPVTDRGVAALFPRGVKKSDALDKLDASGANLFKGFSDYYFSNHSDQVINPEAGNSNNRLIVQGKSPAKSDNRTFLHVTPDMVNHANTLATKEFIDIELEPGDTHMPEIKEIADEGIEFFLISALYRGYDISFGSAIDPTIVENAFKKYNRHLKPVGQKTYYVSSVPNGSSIYVDNVDSFINNLDQGVAFKKPVVKVNDSNLLLNYIIPDSDRRTFGVYKKASNRAKMRVATKITDVFTKLMPHIDIQMMTDKQVIEEYGYGFSGKGGFNIGNKITLNLDFFDSSTVFHEFGHYYMEWLRQENPAALARLLEITAEKYSNLVPDYTASYNATGIQFSAEQVLEEIFLDNLGMKAAATLEYGLNEVDDADIEDSVENFAKNFLIKLTRDMTIDPTTVGFSIDSSIAEIFNIGLKHAHKTFSTPLLDDLDSADMKSFANFFMEEISVRETFDKLVSRGLIQTIPNGDVVLTDEFGNRYNADGDIDQDASYKMNAWDTPGNIKKNREFIQMIEGYLYKHRNQAGVMYQVSKEPTKAIISKLKRMNEAVKLEPVNEETYIVAGNSYNRTTGYIGETFTADVDPEVYVISHVYYSQVRNFKRKNKDRGYTKEELERAAADYARRYVTEEAYETEFAKDARSAREIFKFKTEEGTYLHALGEMFFRALNLAEKIDYASEREGGRMHFASRISKAISHIGSDESNKYFKNLFFDRIQGTKLEGTPEAKQFKEIYDFLLKNMSEKSSADAFQFLTLVTKKVVPALNKLPGPLEIMPEFKAYSDTLGLAGTIDLLVVDGKGIGHIYDYKTKETGKKHYWNTRSGVSMKGAMNARQENAESRAAIQTSMYKIMLAEIGVRTGPSHIFYVENDMYDNNYKHPNDPEVTTALDESIEDAFSGDLKYTPTNLEVLRVPNTTAELLVHFDEMGIKPKIDNSNTAGEDIKSFMFEIAGGVDLDINNDITATADMIYEKSLNLQGDGNYTDNTLNTILAGLGEKVTNVKRRGHRVALAGGTIITLDHEIEGKDAIVAEIQRLLIERRDVRGVANEFEAVFGSLDRDVAEGSRTLRTYSKEKAFRGMLSGVDPMTWSLIDFAEDDNFGVNFSEIEMMTNDITGESRICIINHDKDMPLKFESGHNNIMGNYISNRQFKNKLPSIQWENSIHKMRFVKAGLMMIMRKDMDRDFTVSSVVANRAFDEKSEVPYVYDVSTILSVTKAMIEVARDNGAVVPQKILDLLEDPKMFDARSYQKSPLASLEDFLNMTSGGLIRTQDLFKKDSKGDQHTKALKDLLNNYGDGQAEIGHVLDSLYDFRNSLEQSVYFEVEDRINSDLWTMTDKAILYLNGFNYDLMAKDSTFINEFLMATSKASNSYMAAMNRKTYEGTSRIREDFMAYKMEHNKLIDALAKEEGYNINVLGEALFRSSMGKIFDDLYTTNNTDRNTAFQLKTPEEVTGPAKKAYLKYMRETLELFANRSSFTEIKIPYGWMPLTAASDATVSSNADSLERARESLNSMVDNNKYFGDKHIDTVDSVFAVENRYKGQFPYKNPEAERQYTPTRRHMLGIEYNGQLSATAKNRPLNKIESNLENVLDNFVIAALDAEHYKDVSAFGRSLFYTIKRQEGLTKNSYSNLINTVQLIQKRNVLHEESEDSSKVQKNINKAVTASAIAGTVTQALLETFTNPMVTASNYIGDKLYEVMFSGKREFSFKSYTEAIRLVWTDYGKHKDVINALDVLYGITLFDVKSVKQTFNKLEKNSMWQSKHFMSVNKLMLDNWQRITMVAYMIEEGTFYAHSINPETGVLEYDETKDERFKIRPTDDKETRLDKKMRYKATKEEMSKQRNGLTGDRTTPYEERKLKRAWTQYDATHVKELIVETYASMDESSRSLASYYTYMGLITKMRQWLFPRMPRYFQKPLTAEENQSAARLQKVDDPDAKEGFRYEWRGEASEGIWYTILHLVREVGEHKTAVFKDGTLSNKQKKNVATLIGDMSVSMILAGAAMGIFKYGLDDEERKDPLAQLTYMRFMMATTDVFFLASLFEISSGNSSMFIPVAIMRRVLGSYIDVLLIPGAFLTEKDYTEEDALSTINNALANTHGIYRTGEMVYDEATAE